MIKKNPIESFSGYLLEAIFYPLPAHELSITPIDGLSQPLAGRNKLRLSALPIMTAWSATMHITGRYNLKICL